MAKSGKIKDPFASREAQKYDDPIPSREYILSHMKDSAAPVDFGTLCADLQMQTETQCEALRRRLKAMSRDGQLISNRRGVFGVAGRMELIKGRIQGSKDDYGFFIPADGSEDMYLSSKEMKKVFDGDTVLARLAGVDNRGRKEGMIVEILQRGCEQIVGRYYSESGIGILVPANRRISHEILVPATENRGASDGQFVVGEITSFPSARHKPIARIIEILGDSTTPGLEIDIAIRNHNLPHQWPAAVKKQVKKIDETLSGADLQYREDLRHLPFVTIDGEDAKDFDDAVFAEPARFSGKPGWKLFVAIADVSHYVGVDSALDEEATSRGTSVYFPGHVIPMLPEDLSNGVCSLKPKQDRLVMVCEMDIDEQGTVKDYRFYEGVIHSHARLIYTEVADILEPMDSEAGQNLQQRLKKRHDSLIVHLEAIYALYKELRKAREQGGALDFNSTETRIVFGENRRIKEIVPVVRNCAHRLIEECMLCANVAAGKLLQPSGLPALFRVHEGPSAEKLERLREYLRGMGLALGGGDKPEPFHYQKLLQQVAVRADAHLLQGMVIRSMMQAVYQAENVGHFGLGFGVYTHFTSPIRRYPDLLVHRAIRYLIRNKKSKHLSKSQQAQPLTRNAIYPYSGSDMQTLGENCSLAERRADAASYEVIDWLKCEYMQSHVGDDFQGTIAAVTGFGIFVELESIFIEGLVHITALDNDYYHFDAASHVLTGERTGKHYRMGDSVRVRVAAVNLDDRKIDLVMADTASAAGKPKAKSGGRRSGSSRDSKTGGRKSGKVAKAANSSNRNKSGNQDSKADKNQKSSSNTTKSSPGKKDGKSKKARNASKARKEMKEKQARRNSSGAAAKPKSRTARPKNGNK